ncbi:hypothetical protein IAQ61_007707 [Plenodomus lingam]|uniref:uncharacterized protein n=1 Tax=Leptosphaeria maculans TaxID=5022 RepID=UPI00332AE4BB|nr:hypothetical protein IAQ61_007707 [Plenodomus lingam]
MEYADMNETVWGGGVGFELPMVWSAEWEEELEEGEEGEREEEEEEEEVEEEENEELPWSLDPLTVTMSRVNLSTNTSSATQTSDHNSTPSITTAPLRTQPEFYMTGVTRVSSRILIAQVQVNCTICLERLLRDVVRLHACNHMFHTECIIPWFDRSAPRNGDRRGTCPNCRCELYVPDPQPSLLPALRDPQAPEIPWWEDIDGEGDWADEDEEDDDDDDDEAEYETHEHEADESDSPSTDSETRRFDARIRALNASDPARPSYFSNEENPFFADFDYSRISHLFTSASEAGPPSTPLTPLRTGARPGAGRGRETPSTVQRGTRIPRRIPPSTPPS